MLLFGVCFILYFLKLSSIPGFCKNSYRLLVVYCCVRFIILDADRTPECASECIGLTKFKYLKPWTKKIEVHL